MADAYIPNTSYQVGTTIQLGDHKFVPRAEKGVGGGPAHTWTKSSRQEGIAVPVTVVVNKSRKAERCRHFVGIGKNAVRC